MHAAKDPLLTLECEDTMLLVRNVEMFQWIEEFRPDVDHFNEREYFYNKEWSSNIHNSLSFTDRMLQQANPNAFPFYSEQFVNKVNLGGFVLQQSQIEALDDL